MKEYQILASEMCRSVSGGVRSNELESLRSRRRTFDESRRLIDGSNQLKNDDMDVRINPARTFFNKCLWIFDCSKASLNYIIDLGRGMESGIAKSRLSDNISLAGLDYHNRTIDALRAAMVSAEP